MSFLQDIFNKLLGNKICWKVIFFCKRLNNPITFGGTNERN